MSVRIPTFEEILAVSHSRGGMSYAPGLWDGLVGAWPLQEPGGATAFDASGRGNNGTLTNMDPATDRVVTPYGYGIHFPNTNGEYVLLPVIAYSSVGTLSAWLKWDDFASNATGFEARNNSSNILQFANYWSPNIYWGWYTAAVEYRMSNTPATYGVVAGGYNHFAMTWSGSARALYRNGNLIDSGGAVTTFTVTGSGYLGNFVTGTAPFQGTCVNFLYHDRLLASAEIAQLYIEPWAMYRQRRRVFAAAVAPSAGKPTHFMYYQRLRRAG